MAKVNVDYEYIKYRMSKKGMKCKDLAEEADMDLADLYNMLTKKSSPKILTRLYNICKTLDMDLMDILMIEEQE